MTIFSPSDNTRKLEQVDGDGPDVKTRRPFDISGLDSIPRPGSDDPPYRDWWVIDDNCGDRGG